MTSMNRDPSNPDEMRLSILRWLDSRDAEHEHDQATRDEADVEFEKALLDQGVVNPDEVVDKILKNYWRCDERGLPSSVNVMITTEDGRCVGICISRTSGLIVNTWEV